MSSLEKDYFFLSVKIHIRSFSDFWFLFDTLLKPMNTQLLPFLDVVQQVRLKDN